MSLASQTSPAAHAHRRRLHRSLRGKLPLKASAASLAVKRLRRMGLTRKQAPDLFEAYMTHYVAMLSADPSE